jgi:hypothetical protein
MAHAPKFASGQWALGHCDICAFRYRLLDLKPTTVRGRKTGLLACPTCWDRDHEQNFLDKYVTVDPQALRYARPDIGKNASRQLYPPGNWINGQPPTAAQQAALEAAEKGETA